jgi:hypothetical protein
MAPYLPLAVLLALFPLACAALAERVARPLAPRERTLVAGAALLAAVVAALSPAAPINDQWTHFVHLREALADPVRLLDPWDRPGFTLLYAAPAALGLTAARLTSALAAAVALAATIRAARALGLPCPWAAGLLLVAQYDFFGQASSTMTELPFAAAFAVAVWGFAERRPWVVAAGLGWCGITRPEGILFAAAGAGALLLRDRRAAPAAAALLPLGLWGLAGALAFGDLLWWLRANPYGGLVAPRLEVAQLAESWFFEALRRGQPPVLIVLEVAGGALAVAGPARRLRFLLAPLALSFVVLTFVRIGLTDDWRESRYLVAVAPALALLAAAGLHAALTGFPRAAPPVLLCLAAAGSARELAWNWRTAFGGGVVPVALAWAGMLVVAALLSVRRRGSEPTEPPSQPRIALLSVRKRMTRAGVTPLTALALLLVIPLACSPPGTYGKHRPEQVSPDRGTDDTAPKRVFSRGATFGRSSDPRARRLRCGARAGLP